MNCDNCGLVTQEDFKFCPRCGAVLEKRVVIDRSRIKASREDVFKVIQARTKSDELVTPFWIYVMIFFFLAELVAAFSIGFSIAGDIIREGSTFSRELLFEEMKGDLWVPAMFSVLFYGLAAVLAYVLVSRQNRHFLRDQELRKSLLALTQSAASSPNAGGIVEGEIERMGQIDHEMNATEKRRNPVIWAIAIAAPLIVSAVQLSFIYSGESYDKYDDTSLQFSLLSLLTYILVFDLSFFLGKTIYKHHEQMGDFSEETMIALSKLGLKEKNPRGGLSVVRKSYWLFTFVTIISVGMFMFYWWYTLIEDPNRHLKSQWMFEDSLVETLSD